MIPTARGKLPRNEASRPNGKLGRPTTIFFTNGSNVDSTSEVRAQFLRRRGFSNSAILMLSPMIWGAV
jgi:hypothetical protein